MGHDKLRRGDHSYLLKTELSRALGAGEIAFFTPRNLRVFAEDHS